MIENVVMRPFVEASLDSVFYSHYFREIRILGAYDVVLADELILVTHIAQRAVAVLAGCGKACGVGYVHSVQQSYKLPVAKQ